MENSASTISSSAEQQPLCSLCNQHPAKYACPRCRTRTCSLPCSRAHKSLTSCSGIRDKAAYVPLNKYNWGTMMDDYSFLEDVGRKVGEWGREIVNGGFDMTVAVDKHFRGKRPLRGKERGPVREMARRRVGRGGGKSKREILKMKLEEREIEIELLPPGMERRACNQSTWDFKSETAYMTIQFNFHPPFDTVDTPSGEPYILLTHRNSLSIPLLSLAQQQVKDRLNKKSNASASPPWLSTLLIPPPEDPENFTVPRFLIVAPPDPLLLARSSSTHTLSPPVALSGTTQGNSEAEAKPKLKLYYALDPNEILFSSLRGTAFVEFPIIDVFGAESQLDGMIVDKQTGILSRIRPSEDGGGDWEPRRKRRKLGTEEGKKAIHGLVGDYGSEEDEEDEEDEGLVGYEESEDDEEAGFGYKVENDGDEVEKVDPATLLELVRQVQKDADWGDDDDEVDDEVELGITEAS